MFRAALNTLAGLALLMASPLAAEEQDAPPTPLAVAQSYVEAYNARDLDAMMALMHDEVEWLAIERSEAQAFAKGKGDLTRQMESYFSSPMATTSTIDGSVIDGRFVAVREIARWTGSDGKPREQSALAVYEIENGLVRRVWYYPATR
jgi:hypothetical protein